MAEGVVTPRAGKTVLVVVDAAETGHEETAAKPSVKVRLRQGEESAKSGRGREKHVWRK